MSRSFKKTPYSGDHSSKKFGKKYANKRVRNRCKNPDTILNNKSYKKAYESWDICDYGGTRTFNEFKKRYYHFDPESGKYYDSFKYYTEKDIYNEWYLIYKRK